MHERHGLRRPPPKEPGVRRWYDRGDRTEAPMAGGPLVYPERDGKPMGESDEHIIELNEYALETLQDVFEKKRRSVYVAGTNLLYFTEGVLEDCVSPDCYVVKGVPGHPRRTFKVWEERGSLPCWVLEITSRSTRREDLGDKM